jgi:hypothetical protein
MPDGEKGAKKNGRWTTEGRARLERRDDDAGKGRGERKKKRREKRRKEDRRIGVVRG